MRVLVVEDVVTLADDIAAEVDGLSFAPLFMVATEPVPVRIGLGDLLILVLYPPVATKAFGRAAGVVAALFLAGFFENGFPMLTLLAPLIIAQCVLCRMRGQEERSMSDWRAAAWRSTCGRSPQRAGRRRRPPTNCALAIHPSVCSIQIM